MSTFEQAIIDYLNDNASIGAVVDNRIYPAPAPSNTTRPYITLQRISVNRTYHLGGSAELAETLMQFDCVGTTYLSARTVADTLRQVLDTLGKTTIGDPGSTVALRSTYLVSERDDYDGPSDASDRAVHRVSMDFRFWHVETLP